MKKIELIAEITKVTRTANKSVAQVSIVIPAEKAGELPMGKVNISIENLQAEMFGDK